MKFDFSKWFTIVTALAPMVLFLVPHGQALLPFAGVIIAGITDAQKKIGATGPEKKAFVQQLVGDAAAGTNLVRPGTIDPALAVEAAGHAIDAIITSVNAVRDAHAALPNAPSLIITH